MEGGDGVEEACCPPRRDPGEGTVTRGKALSHGEKVPPLEPVLCRKRTSGEGGSGAGQQRGKKRGRVGPAERSGAVCVTAFFIPS